MLPLAALGLSFAAPGSCCATFGLFWAALGSLGGRSRFISSCYLLEHIGVHKTVQSQLKSMFDFLPQLAEAVYACNVFIVQFSGFRSGEAFGRI